MKEEQELINSRFRSYYLVKHCMSIACIVRTYYTYSAGYSIFNERRIIKMKFPDTETSFVNNTTYNL